MSNREYRKVRHTGQFRGVPAGQRRKYLIETSISLYDGIEEIALAEEKSLARVTNELLELGLSHFREESGRREAC